MSNTCEITGFTNSQQERWALTHGHLTSNQKVQTHKITSAVSEKLSKQVLEFISNQEISKSITARKEGIIKDLKKRFDIKFRGSKLTTFGSSESGLGLRNGDVDLCLEFTG